MTKMYKKSELKVIEDRLVAEDGTVIGIDCEVLHQLSELETMYQKAMWLKDQPVACAGPDYGSFERVHKMDQHEWFCIDTPKIDEAVQDSLALMRELDQQGVISEINGKLGEFSMLMSWCDSDYVVECQWSTPPQIDAPFIMMKYGDVLSFTSETIRDIVAEIFREKLLDKNIEVGYEIEEATDGEPKQG